MRVVAVGLVVAVAVGVEEGVAWAVASSMLSWASGDFKWDLGPESGGEAGSWEEEAEVCAPGALGFGGPSSAACMADGELREGGWCTSWGMCGA